MELLGTWTFAGRFTAGLAGVALTAGALRLGVPGFPAAACLASGVLAAGIFALVRGGRLEQAVLVALVAPVFQLAAVWDEDPARAVVLAGGRLVEGGGATACALVFHFLAERGVRLGKFLLAGPMLALAYAVARAAALVGEPAGGAGTKDMVLWGLVGLVVGDAVGAGLELGELAMAASGARRARAHEGGGA